MMMRVSDYIVEKLIEHGVTDVFGGLGGSVLDLVDSLRSHKDKIKAHLNYHEQASSFAANGYAKMGAPFGVVFATKGPGFLNLLSGMASAFYDSVPVLFIVGHYLTGDVPSHPVLKQEMNTVAIVKSFTKYSARIDNIDDIRYEVEKAAHLLTSGRPGPVFLDIHAKVLSSEFEHTIKRRFAKKVLDVSNEAVEEELFKKAGYLKKLLNEAKRPVILLGDGVHQAKREREVLAIIERLGIPALSSRHSQDIAKGSEYFYGFIGSNGIRYANMILEKSDLIITFGNRLMIKEDSDSYSDFFIGKKLVRFEIDKTELERKFAGEVDFNVDLRTFLPYLAKCEFSTPKHQDWIKKCQNTKTILWKYDLTAPDTILCAIFDRGQDCGAIASDVGKNERWTANAYFISKNRCRFLYTNGLGVMGNALPTAIGAYYKTKKRVIACVGDAGLQLSMSELQYISEKNVPVAIIIQNNHSLGTVRDAQARKFNRNFYLTTCDTGYATSDYKAVAAAFGIHYVFIKCLEEARRINFDDFRGSPVIIEFEIDPDLQNIPKLPPGRPLSHMSPDLPPDVVGNLAILRAEDVL
jgi:acetolactate synthase-1/2/3 large subunit